MEEYVSPNHEDIREPMKNSRKDCTIRFEFLEEERTVRNGPE